MSARPVRWLHLSDLHFVAGDGYAHGVVLDALVDAFKERGTLAERKPDLIFCTGDIAQSGKAEEYEAAGRFFGKLAQATGVPREGIFVVPGNHDVDRELIDDNVALRLDSRERVDTFFGPKGLRTRRFAGERFEAYAAFQRALNGIEVDAERPYFLTHHVAGAERFGILGLNSAWLAAGDRVQGSLVVGERLLHDALMELDRGGPTVKVAMLHHPLDWLAPFECAVVKSILVEGVDFILHGHLHSQRPEILTGPEGRVAVLAAGAAYQGRACPNAALLVELDGAEARAEAIAFRGEPQPEGRWRFQDRPAGAGAAGRVGAAGRREGRAGRPAARALPRRRGGAARDGDPHGADRRSGGADDPDRGDLRVAGCDEAGPRSGFGLPRAARAGRRRRARSPPVRA
jgi:predicted phosphodiesterase